jgi:hypothetical protein
MAGAVAGGVAGIIGCAWSEICCRLRIREQALVIAFTLLAGIAVLAAGI